MCVCGGVGVTRIIIDKGSHFLGGGMSYAG